MRVRTFQLWLCSLMLLASCSPSAITGSEEMTGEEVPLRYATLLRMQRADDFTVCDVRDPWHPQRRLHRYVLLPRGAALPEGLPEGPVVRTPLQRAVSFTSVHAGLCADLGVADALCGVCDVAYVHNDSILRRLADGRLQDMGAAHLPSIERLAAARSDALLVSPFENVQYGAIESLDVPLIECADYMETSPLGRAEWVRFFGLLFGAEAEADSLFAETERCYSALKQRALADSARPTVLIDHLTQGTWYVPGGHSTTGRLIADAGGRYVFADDTISGSVALAFEAVYAAGRDADVWLTKYGAARDATYASLAADYAPNARFRAWRERRVWGCNVTHVPVFDETPFRPDLLLADFVHVLHPAALPHHTLRYYHPLSE